jgi:hypothetical protein
MIDVESTLGNGSCAQSSRVSPANKNRLTCGACALAPRHPHGRSPSFPQRRRCLCLTRPNNHHHNIGITSATASYTGTSTVIVVTYNVLRTLPPIRRVEPGIPPVTLPHTQLSPGLAAPATTPQVSIVSGWCCRCHCYCCYCTIWRSGVSSRISCPCCYWGLI